MDFGLGLVLSFTDNASDGMRKAVSSLEQLTETASNASNELSELAQLGAFSAVADQMGTGFMNAGKKIMGVFETLLGNVKNTGSEFEDFRITLGALYGSAEKAEKQVQKLLNFSIKSPFEVNEVKDMLVVLKSQGLEAFSKVRGELTGTRQETLSWFADLMAFKPDEATIRWKRAIQNYIGSGESLILEHILDQGQISDIIGRDIGATVEERMQDIVDIVENTGITGLAEKLSLTWGGVASNISDAFTQLYLAIADNGVFEELKRAFNNVAGAIMQLSPDEIAALGKTLAEGLDIIVKPLTFVADHLNEFIKGVVSLCQTNPGLVKFGMAATAAAGALLLLGGIVLKAMSAFALFSIGLQEFSGSFSLITKSLRLGVSTLTGTLLPLTIFFGVLYYTWKNDIAGIRTLLTHAFDDINIAVKNSRIAMTKDVSGMVSIMEKNSLKNTFASKLTNDLIKLGVIASALHDAWGDYTLSDDNFRKCEELGVLPLIERILDLKWRMEHFADGFKTGFENVFKPLVKEVKEFFKELEDVPFVDKLIEKVTEFFTLITDNDPESWRQFGEITGEMAGHFVIATAALMILNAALGKMSTLLTTFSLLGGIVSGAGDIILNIGSSLLSAFPNITGTLTTIGEMMSTAITEAFGSNLNLSSTLRVALAGVQDTVMEALGSLASIIGIPVEAVGAIIMIAIGSIIAYATTHWEEFKEKISGIWTTIQEEADEIWGTIKEGFSSIWENIKENVDSVAEKFSEFQGKLSSFGEWISSTPVFKMLETWFIEIGRVLTDTLIPAIQGVIEIASTVFQSLFNVVVTVFNSIVDFIGTALTSAMDIIGGILDVIVGIFTGDFELIFDGVSSIISGVFDFVTSTMENLSNITGSILDGLLSIFDSIFQAILNVVQGYVNGVLDALTEVLSGVSSTASDIVTIIKNGFNSAVTYIKNLASQAFTWGSDFVHGLVRGIESGIDKIRTAASSVAGAIKSFLHFSVPDEGPLTEYESWMPDFMNGLAESILRSEGVVIDALDKFSGDIRTSLTEETMLAFRMFGDMWIQQMEVIIRSSQMMQSGVSESFEGIIMSITNVGRAAELLSRPFEVLMRGFTLIPRKMSTVGDTYSSTIESMLRVTQVSVKGMGDLYVKMTEVFIQSTTSMRNAAQTNFSAISNIASTQFSYMASAISTQMSSAVSSVRNAVAEMKNAMNFTWSLPDLKVPHINVSGNFNVDPPSAPKFDVSWYEKGGVFSSPSIIGVGENGREAVMPLENNTDWIGDLALMISSYINSIREDMQPVAGSETVSNTTSTARYVTSNVNNDNSNVEHHVDNSVTFNEGAIQINCQNASEEEAVRMAQKIMSYIERQHRINSMMSYK